MLARRTHLSEPSERSRTANPTGRSRPEPRSRSAERSVAGQNRRVWSGASRDAIEGFPPEREARVEWYVLSTLDGFDHKRPSIARTCVLMWCCR